MGVYCHQRGQAVASFLIASVFLLVPISLGINYLAKIGDARHKTHEAARYALWERTAWHRGGSGYNIKTDTEINNEITSRIYGKAGIPINSLADKSSADRESELDANLYLWGEERNSVLKEYSESKVTELNIRNASASGGFSAAIGLAGDLLELDSRGFHVVEVSVNFNKAKLLDKQLSAFLPDGNNIHLKSKSSMLIGSWSAYNQAAIEDHVDGTLLTSRIADVPGFDVLRSSIAAFHPEIGRLDLGIIQPDIVPCQRINRTGLSCR
jgi:hypothetical protein